MANYKPDIEKKLNKEKDTLLSEVPEFVYTYVEDEIGRASCRERV